MAQRLMYFQHAEKIIEAGKVEQRMYIILEGEVEILLSDGTNKVIVAVLKKGDFFGEISLFNRSPRSATATANGQVKLTYIDNYEQLKNFLTHNPSFAAKMVQTLATRLAETDRILLGKISEINRLKLTRI